MASMGGGLSLGTLWVEVGARVDAAVQVLQDFGDVVSGQLDKQRDKWNGLADVGGEFLKVGASLTAGITAPLAGLGLAAVKSAEGINVAKVAFTTMLGSGEAADKMLKDLQAFAATTPFEFNDLVKAAQRMKALGFEAKDVIPTLRTIGDASAAMGGSADTINGITLALGQMTAKGRVSAQEMNQLAERGIPAWQILADAIGKDIPTAMKMAENGAVHAATAVPAILDGMNKRFGGSMEAMSKTLTGQWSNMKDQLTMALIPIGQALIPSLQSLIPVLTQVLTYVADLANWFNNLPGPMKTTALGLVGLVAAIGPVVSGFGGLFLALGKLGPGFTAVSQFFGLVSNASSMGGAVNVLSGAIGSGGLAGSLAMATPLLIAFGVAIAAWAIYEATVKLKELNRQLDATYDAQNRGVKASDEQGKTIKLLTDYIEGYNKQLANTTKIPIPKFADFQGAVDPVKSYIAELQKLAAAVPGTNSKLSATSVELEKIKTGAMTLDLSKTVAGIKSTGAAAGVTAAELAKQSAAATTAAAAARAAGEAAAAHAKQVAEQNVQITLATARFVTYAANLTTASAAAREHAAAAFEAMIQSDKFGASLDRVKIKAEVLGTDLPQPTKVIGDFGIRTDEATASVERLGATAPIVAGQTKSAFENMATSVSTVITNFAQDAARMLWSSDGGSFGEKAMDMFKRLGEAVTSAFIEPATAALGKFVKDVLVDLVTGQGFGGIMGSLKTLGGSIGGIFTGGASGAASAAGGVASAAGGVASGAGSAVSGIMGGIVSALNPISMVANVVGSVASVLQLFGVGQGGQLDRLNRISDATGYMAWALDTGGIRIAVLDIKNMTSWVADGVGRIANNSDYTNYLLENLNASSAQMNLTLVGTDPRQVASYLATQLRLQGVV